MATLSVPRRKQQDTVAPDSRQGRSKPNGNSLERNPTDSSEPEGNAQRGRALTKKRKIYYPTGDGKPMAEDKLHRKQMAYGCDALELHFASRPDVYVSGNDFVYYEENNPKARVSPDCYVALGVEPKDERRLYKIWEENGIAPAVVFEFTSKKTKKDDVTVKKPLYEQVLQVQEYFQFDPTGDYLRPRLQGQRLHEGVYQPIELRDNRMFSEQLGLELVVEGKALRFYDPTSGEWLRSYKQAEEQRLQAEEQREAANLRAAEEAQRAKAEAQRAEVAERRAETESQRAEVADRRAELEAQRAAEEAQRAEAAEEALKLLRQEFEAFRQQQ